MTNVFRGDGLDREIDEELRAHLQEAIEQGRDPGEAREAFGSALRRKEESRDVRVIPWLDSLRADAVFGWRQIQKRKVTSAVAILSVGLAIGACTAAFRLIDTLLLRPLPVAAPERLYALSRRGIGFDGKPQTFDSWAYPAFRLMRAAVKDQAELIAVSYAERIDLTYRSDQEMEKACLQYVSGWMFGSFGLRPAVAIGAQAGDIARRVTADVFAMVLAGAAVGAALGMASARYVEALLYGVKATDLGMLALPALAMLAAALVAAVPAVTRAVRIDPVAMLRAD